jgi:hypothetical protein
MRIIKDWGKNRKKGQDAMDGSEWPWVCPSKQGPGYNHATQSRRALRRHPGHETGGRTKTQAQVMEKERNKINAVNTVNTKRGQAHSKNEVLVEVLENRTGGRNVASVQGTDHLLNQTREPRPVQHLPGHHLGFRQVLHQLLQPLPLRTILSTPFSEKPGKNAKQIQKCQKSRDSHSGTTQHAARLYATLPIASGDKKRKNLSQEKREKMNKKEKMLEP